MQPLRVLFDGWPLSRAPNSPAALHLLAILAQLPESIQPVVAFPEPSPAWTPPRAQAHTEATPLAARLKWEQRLLPRLRRKLDADLLHMTTAAAALLDAGHTVVSPAAAREPDLLHPAGAARGGLRARLREALAAGGMRRARTVFWPDDLPAPAGAASLPPLVHPAFAADASETDAIPGVELPETFVLYHGPQDEFSLRRALESWTWVAGPIGGQYPLVMLGLGKPARLRVDELAASLRVQDTIVPLPAIPPGWVAAVYRRAAVVFHPAGASVWGGAIRHALASGKPLVAAETARTNAIVGPAAILVDARDTRRLGASVIGSVVKEDLAERLRAAALERSAGWADAGWGEKLAAAYARARAA